MDSTPKNTKWLGLAMIFSIIQFVAVLFILNKVQSLTLPIGELNVLETMAMGSSVLFILAYIIFAKKALTQKKLEDKFSALIVSYAINEIPVLIAFIATMMSENGNGFFITINASVALVMNFIFFSKT